MAQPVLRPMLGPDVDPAAEMILGHGWGVRRDWLAFAVDNDRCTPLVAEVAGGIVATGVGTVNGRVGWLGSVFVATQARGRGLGRAITQAVLDRLDTAGCATVVLVATSEGRRLYERMGFEVETRYRIVEAPGLADAEHHPGSSAGTAAATAARDLTVRPFGAADLAAVAALARVATGADRRHVLERLATPDAARVAAAPDGAIAGFVVRPPWGGGATIAATPGTALAIIEARRRGAGAAGRVRVGILDENTAGMEQLERAGFVHAWSAPRMVRGAPISWHPDWIWGQFNHAMG